jgi:hypothetical protein
MKSLRINVIASLTLLLCFVLTTSVFAEPSNKSPAHMEGEYVVTKSIDDATGLPTTGLPPSYGGIHPNLAAGNYIYQEAYWYGSSYVVEKKYIGW